MRKNTTHILFTLTLLLLGTAATIAQKLDTTTIVTIKPYDPVLSDAFKLKDNPSIQDTDKVLVNDSELINELARRQPEVLLTVGAGDIDKQVAKIKDYFTPKTQASA